jgi:hypothetical protein
MWSIQTRDAIDQICVIKLQSFFGYIYVYIFNIRQIHSGKCLIANFYNIYCAQIDVTLLPLLG